MMDIYIYVYMYIYNQQIHDMEHENIRLLAISEGSHWICILGSNGMSF